LQTSQTRKERSSKPFSREAKSAPPDFSSHIKSRNPHTTHTARLVYKCVNKPMPIICFFGPDGSGKSTLAKALTKRLNNQNFRVKLSWMRGTHTLASLLAKLLSKSATFKGSENPYYKTTIPRNLKRLWQLLEFVSALPVILLKFILPSTLGSWVIAERYTPDFITWISITTNDQHYPKSIEARFLLALASKAHAKIHVTATLKELSRRRKETNPNFVSDQLKLYDQIASTLHAHKLDTTNKSVNQSLEKVLSVLDPTKIP